MTVVVVRDPEASVRVVAEFRARIPRFRLLPETHAERLDRAFGPEDKPLAS